MPCSLSRFLSSSILTILQAPPTLLFIKHKSDHMTALKTQAFKTQVLLHIPWALHHYFLLISQIFLHLSSFSDLMCIQYPVSPFFCCCHCLQQDPCPTLHLATSTGSDSKGQLRSFSSLSGAVTPFRACPYTLQFTALFTTYWLPTLDIESQELSACLGKNKSLCPQFLA